jgi:nucleoid-associated protein YgaU
MARNKSKAAAIAILLVGVCASLPFRRPLEKESPAIQPDSELLWRQATSHSAVTGPELAPPAQAAIAENSELAESTEAASNPPPASAQDIAAEVAAPPSTTPSVPTAISPYLAERRVPPAASNDVAERPPTPARPILEGWRRHRIRDGDTLAKIAQRYLGDPSRANEVYGVNRDVLHDPDILPIGRWLRIPPQDSISTP